MLIRLMGWDMKHMGVAHTSRTHTGTSPEWQTAFWHSRNPPRQSPPLKTTQIIHVCLNRLKKANGVTLTLPSKPQVTTCSGMACVRASVRICVRAHVHGGLCESANKRTSTHMSFMLWGSSVANVMRDLCVAIGNVFAPGNMNFSRNEGAKGGMITTSESYCPCCLLSSENVFFLFFIFLFQLWRITLWNITWFIHLPIWKKKTHSQKISLDEFVPLTLFTQMYQ